MDEKLRELERKFEWGDLVAGKEFILNICRSGIHYWDFPKGGEFNHYSTVPEEYRLKDNLRGGLDFLVRKCFFCFKTEHLINVAKASVRDGKVVQEYIREVMIFHDSNC